MCKNLFRVEKASLVHRDQWARRETLAEMDSMAYLGGLARRENLAFLGWMELLAWTDQEDCLGLDNILYLFYIN